MGGKSMNITHFQDIDWALLWKKANSRKKLQRKKSTDWDQKAESFATRTAHSVYTKKFIKLLRPQKDWTVLDIGCGPGTLALPLARQVKQLTALDFSAAMLDILKKKAAQSQLNNISCHQLAWEDNWEKHNIAPHHVAIASRSMAVADLKASLLRLNSFATRLVCITDRVKYGPKDPDAFTAIGRKKISAPDYIYTVNLLYQMGILPKVDYIRLEEQLNYPSFSDALASYTWMFKDLTVNEMKKLEEYVKSISTTNQDNSITLQRRHVPVWAFISWQPSLLHL
jgi:SAM-dependent methyltransferase